MITKSWPYSDYDAFLKIVLDTFATPESFGKNVSLIDLSKRLHIFAEKDRPPMLLTFEENEKVIAACIRTDPAHGFIFSDLPDSVISVACRLIADKQPPSLFGNSTSIEKIRAHPDFDASTIDAEVGMTYYSLESPSLIFATSGVVRQAEPKDVEKIATWLEEFRLEAAPEDPPMDTLARAKRGIEARQYYVYEANGELQGFIGHNGDTETPKIAPVYTDKKFRRQNVGAYLVSSLCKTLGEQKGTKHIGLFADKNYAPSNGLYLKLGFEVVASFTKIMLKP